jgi:plastocyanin
MRTIGLWTVILGLIVSCRASVQAGAVAGPGMVTGQATLAGKSGAEGIVVYLDGEAKSQPLTHAVVDQRDKMFLPHVSVVTRGTRVKFPNDDTVFHNVFAYFQAKKFDLGMYPRGATKEVTFDKPGLVVLLCNVHSDMSAYIMVVDTPYYAVTDKQGRFRIAGVPPGTYTLHAWHESGASLTQPITVKAGETTLPLILAGK